MMNILFVLLLTLNFIGSSRLVRSKRLSLYASTTIDNVIPNPSAPKHESITLPYLSPREKMTLATGFTFSFDVIFSGLTFI